MGQVGGTELGFVGAYIVIVFVVGTHDGRANMWWQSTRAPRREVRRKNERCAASIRKSISKDKAKEEKKRRRCCRAKCVGRERRCAFAGGKSEGVDFKVQLGVRMNESGYVNTCLEILAGVPSQADLQVAQCAKFLRVGGEATSLQWLTCSLGLF